MTATTPALDLGIPLEHRFASDLPELCLPWQAQAAPQPRMLWFNQRLARELGLDADRLAGPESLPIWAGQNLPAGAVPVAQAYAGHQFGGYSPRLGDGRALLLGEVQDPQGQHHDIAFKGSGPTPFSRGGDGKAAVGPVLREALLGEAMHALGIPTTRALAVVATGETIQRQEPLPGALLTRVASSHLRVGTFQYAAARGDAALLQRLADHAMARHAPGLAHTEPDTSRRTLRWLQAVAERQAALVARWMGVGFIHGVMNTDNMALSGQTIDYGPCAFMEAHDPDTVFSSIDRHGRYAWGNQPGVAQWNLARLAEAVLALIHPDSDTAVALATEAVNGFATQYARHWLTELRGKLGLVLPQPSLADSATLDEADLHLAQDYLQLLHAHGVDHTLGFRRLSDALRGQPQAWQALFGPDRADLHAWEPRWQARLAQGFSGTPTAEVAHAMADQMDRCNPLCIPRNHLVEEALQAASEAQNLEPFERLLDALRHPYASHLTGTVYAQPGSPAQTAGYRTFCGT